MKGDLDIAENENINDDFTNYIIFALRSSFHGPYFLHVWRGRGTFYLERHWNRYNWDYNLASVDYRIYLYAFLSFIKI